MEVSQEKIKQIKEIEEIFDMYISDYSWGWKYNISEGHDDESCRVEFVVKHSTRDEVEIAFYFDVYDDKFKFDWHEGVYEELDGENIWKYIAFEAIDKWN